jgi:uncharacterized protein
MTHASDEALVIARTTRWVELFVIGLNLCPFAKAVQVKNQIRYVVSNATKARALRDDLERELASLAGTDPAQVDTTLLIHPRALRDFYAYNDFLAEADALLAELDLEGVLQVASFHPDYCFADADPDDAANFTNRSPYPMLHLLREDSITRAVDSFPDTSAIYERNIATLRALTPAALLALRDSDEQS